MSNTTTSNTSTSPQPPRAPPNQQACAACKHQRRKCTPGCLLAPFFPSSTATSSFQNAHKLFGVKKITKAIQSVPDPAQRALTARSLIAHANARAADPVGGCHRIVCNLNRQIDYCRAELGLVNSRLAMCRAAQQDDMFINNNYNSDNIDLGDVQGFTDVSTRTVYVDNGLQDFNVKGAFPLRNKFGVKEDLELEQEAHVEEKELKFASLNFAPMSDFVHKVEVET